MLGDDRRSVSNVLALLNTVGLATSIYQTLFYAVLEF
jgi:hypothetical protein